MIALWEAPAVVCFQCSYIKCEMVLLLIISQLLSDGEALIRSGSNMHSCSSGPTSDPAFFWSCRERARRSQRAQDAGCSAGGRPSPTSSQQVQRACSAPTASLQAGCQQDVAVSASRTAPSACLPTAHRPALCPDR